MPQARRAQHGLGLDPNPDPAMVAVADRLYDALAVLRIITTVNLIGLTAWRWGNFDRPVTSLGVVALLVCWTAFALWCYRDSARRTTTLLVADLAVALSAMAATPWLKGEDFQATVPGFWVMGPLLAWAVHWHWRGGLVAGGLLTAVDLAIRSHITQANYGNIFLLLLGGTVVGYMVASLQQMAAERAAAERAAAAAAERTRLARAVHDGVLQVLSLVQRRGLEAQGQWADLGRMAGEQESALRSLIRSQDAISHPDAMGRRAASGGPAVRDLAVALESLAASGVTVVTPGVVVPLPQAQVEALVAAARACVDNVRLHVGLDAPAWVLLESTTDGVILSVRDEGPGIGPGRLEEAAREGRLGVASSIVGRLAEVGGTATVTSGPQGTEWELMVPSVAAVP